MKIVRERSEHNISRKNIDPDALKVLYRLKRHGHTAYLVGGGVRDLLLGRIPKDFDIGTDARPRAIKKLFRNCFLIGRRFRLAHIRFGDKVIETSTFRREPEPDGDGDSDDLYQHRDNTFGTPEQDARRRDFTVNGLFYNIADFSVIDYVGGLEDLDKRRIRSIGDPNIRFREDPVRMLRAVRFASRLGFTIEPASFEAIVEHHAEIERAADARLFEEVLRLFGFGVSAPAFELLKTTGLMRPLFPRLDAWLDAAPDAPRVMTSGLRQMDKRMQGGEDFSPAFKLALLFYGPFHADVRCADRAATRENYQRKARALALSLAERFHVPKRVTYEFANLLSMQQRLENGPPRPSSARRFMSQASFPEALALFEMAAAADLQDRDRLEEWRTLYHESLDRGDVRPASRKTKATAPGAPKSRRRSGRRRPRRGRKRRSTRKPAG